MKRVMLLINKVIISGIVLLASITIVRSQSAIRTITGATDRRTAYERATDLLNNGGDSTQAIQLLELWLTAVPFDTNAAKILAAVYLCKGRIEDAELARSVRPFYIRPNDNRVLTRYTPQVRMGSYRILLPKNYTPKQRYPAVLLIHGNGQGPDAMIDFARTLAMDSVIFVCPVAPYIRLKETKQSQLDRYSASGEGIDIPDTLMSEVVDASASWYRDAFMDAETQCSVARIKPIVVGFSQGGFFAHVVASRYPAMFQSVVSIGASMYGYGRFQEYVNNMKIFGIDALVMHGKRDNVVPLQTSELIVATLRNSDVSAELITFEGEHWPTPDAIQTIRTWLKKRLK